MVKQSINTRSDDAACPPAHPAFYKIIFDTVLDGILLADTETKQFTLGNEAVCRMLGYSPREIASLRVEDIHPAKDLPYVLEQFNRQMRGEIALAKDIPVKRKDGSVFYADIKSAQISLDGTRCLIGVFREVTERKRSEDRLKSIMNCYLSFGASPIENINRLTALCGQLLGASCALYNRLDGGMLLSLGQWSTPPDYPPGDRAEGHICYDVIQKGGDDVFLVRDLPNTPYNASDPNVARYGLKTYLGKSVSFAGATVGSLCAVFQREFEPDDTDRRTMAILAAAIGIEETRRHAEEALRSSESFNRIILESVDEGFIVLDSEYRIIAANKGYCETIGTTSAQAAGEHCFVLSHHLDRPCFESGLDCAVRRTFETRASSAAMHSHVDAQGDPVYVEIKSYPLFDTHGNVTSAIETLTDVTARKKLEGQLRHAQKMEAIGTLAGGIAHDFNNILSAIIGYGNLAAMKMSEHDPLHANIENILDAANRAAHLTKSLLTFSRKQVIAMQPVDVNSILRRVEKLLERIIGEDISLRVSSGAGPLNILADGGQLEQVLMNLATNARDAMPGGGGLNITASFSRMDIDFIAAHGFGVKGDYAMISVSDTGEGIDPAVLPKIFEPFFTTKDVGKGTGLGLAIVYGIIKQHNGYICVFSQPGDGTTFTIYLPLLTSDTAAASARKESRVVGGTETILLAEDDDTLRQFTSSVLREFGYRVIEAGTGVEAVSKFRENRDSIKLSILGVIMPHMNGKSASEQMRAISPAAKILFQSGYPLESTHLRGLLNANDHFLSKPTSPQELLNQVRALLDP